MKPNKYIYRYKNITPVQSSYAIIYTDLKNNIYIMENKWSGHKFNVSFKEFESDFELIK